MRFFHKRAEHYWCPICFMVAFRQIKRNLFCCYKWRWTFELLEFGFTGNSSSTVTALSTSSSDRSVIAKLNRVACSSWNHGCASDFKNSCQQFFRLNTILLCQVTVRVLLLVSCNPVLSAVWSGHQQLNWFPCKVFLLEKVARHPAGF